ncbi:hypothetical protein GKR71_00655 [Providencia sp. wls1922]|nr:hypothetical protein [Providencia sp. wls1922]HEM8290996.1 hypothetical protein [Providencia stuartii]
MVNIFVNKIIKNKIKAPTRPDFSLTKWDEEWAKVELHSSERDKKVYTMGRIINSLLSDIRTELANLYTKAPRTSYKRLLTSYIASSNRTLAVAFKLVKERSSENIHEILLPTTRTGNKLSLGEIVHGSVDGFQLAIKQCLRHIKNNDTVTFSDSPINELSFIQQESYLSQLYSTYLHLWQCILWSNYNLIEIDKEKKIYRVEQPKSSLEIAFMNSALRKEKLSANSTLIAMTSDISSLYSDDNYIFIERSNKKKVARVAPIRNATKKLITLNTQWKMTECDLRYYIPEEWLTDDFGNGFCLSEVLEVMRCLMLMANLESEKYPEDDSIFNANKLKEFCPSVQATSLERALCDATEILASKVSKIVNFLTFDSSPTSDLWCQPLIKTESNKYVIATSALNSPVIFRLFEKWADIFEIKLSEKGLVYEKKIINELNSKLNQNSFIIDYDKAISKRIKIGTSEEEFDLLARIDDLVLIGEAKSIVTTDSEISKYRTSETLTHAGNQVARKTKFFKENLKDIFEKLNWNYDESKDYKFAKFIINSSSIFVGHSFNEIPVIDEKILGAYFSSNRINLFDVASGNRVKTIAWYELYDDINKLKANFSKYLSSPPQLNSNSKEYEYNEIQLPFINNNSFKITKKYLVLKSSSLLSPMEQEHMFPVIKSADYDMEASKINARI